MSRQLDLGSANALRGQDRMDEVFGVDIVPSPDPRIKLCDINVNPLPFEDDYFDLVTAFDILEHIVPIIYTKFNGTYQRKTAMIDLFNEIYRVLKHNGKLYMQTPINDFSDPTHVAHWTSETLNHFSGDYYGFHDHYNHTSRFEKLGAREENNHIIADFRAIKTLDPDSEYKVNYPEVAQ
jgi:SAM-dependent methyltransferase